MSDQTWKNVFFPMGKMTPDRNKPNMALESRLSESHSTAKINFDKGGNIIKLHHKQAAWTNMLVKYSDRNSSVWATRETPS